ncbi:MAG: hypothetical protein JWM80_4008 [Cyanobacteria bacterium RYN_339]|nr:hypothetical protein [Cyanobacteria bacterium RYN_339]
MLAATPDPTLEARILEARELPGVRAGSGLAWHGTRLVVVQDDAFAVAIVDPASRAVTHLPLVGAGAALPKAEKPDFEAVFADGGGCLVLVGSGSKPNRCCWATLDLAAGAVKLTEHPALYAAIAEALGGPPNLEGAVVAGNRLRLFHRGDGAGNGTNVVLDLPWDPETGAAPRVVERRAFDLGAVAGVALTFTDATCLPDGRILYLAAAEDTPNAVDDGRVVGAAIGILAGDAVRWAPLLEADGSPSVRKIEGVALAADGLGGYLVTDADDPALPAELLRFALRGPW